MSKTVFQREHIALSSWGNTAAAYTFKSANGEASVTPIAIDTKDKTSGVIASWGANNDYPQKILAQVKKNGSARRGISFRRKGHYGNGINLLRKKATDEGKHDIHIVPIDTVPAINDFWELNQMQRFWKETIADLEWWGIAFPEYILSNDFTKINRVKRQTAAWCRFEVMNEDNGLVENVYISQKFGKDGASPDSKFVSKVALVDSYWTPDEVREYCKSKKIKNFIRPVFFPLIDEAYYPEAEWHSVTESGWLEVANAVPEFKMNMFKNQVSIKYLIEIDERYFTNIYQEEWNKFKPEERKKIRQDVIDAINLHLSGNENAGKSIQSMMFVDEDRKQVSAIKITTIDDKYKDGSYLPEAEAANSEILFSLGVDPSLIGAGIPGGKLGAGSGSDKTAAFNIAMALFKSDRETTLEVFNFLKRFNGWPADVTADFENTILTTMDKNPTGTQKTTA